MSVAGLVRALLGRRAPVWYTPAYRLPIPSLESVSGVEPRRADLVVWYLLERGFVRAADLMTPRRADYASLLRVHDPAYLESLTHADERWWGPALEDGVRRLVLDDELLVRHRGRRGEPIAVWNGAGWPTHGVGLRTAGGAPVQIVDVDGERIGDVDRSRAPEQVHPGASYLHQGQAWRVVSLDLDLSPLPNDAIVYDLVYAPLQTGLLQAAEDRGLETIDGLEMLIGQAALAFELFFDAEPPRECDDELRDLLTR